MLGDINIVNLALIALVALIGVYIQWRRWDPVRFWTKFATLAAAMSVAALVFSLLRMGNPPRMLVEHGPAIILADLAILIVGLVGVYLITPNRWRFWFERGRPSIESYGCGAVLFITVLVLAITFGLSFPTIEALVRYLAQLDLRPLAWAYVPVAVLLSGWVFAFMVSLLGAFSATLTLAMILYSVATKNGLDAVPAWQTVFQVMGIKSPVMKLATMLVTIFAGAIDWSHIVLLDIRSGQLTFRVRVDRSAEEDDAADEASAGEAPPGA